MPLTINKDAAICRASLASQLDTVLLEKVLGITFSLKDTSTSDVWEAGEGGGGCDYKPAVDY